MAMLKKNYQPALPPDKKLYIYGE